jgi:hypothetical protein
MLLVITLTKYSFGAIAIPATVAAIIGAPRSGNGKRSQLIEAGTLFGVLAVSLGFWFLSAGFRGALRFAFDQPQYAPLFSTENIFFYPRAWLYEFHLHPAFGLATAVLACLGVLKGRNRFAVRTAGWVTGFSLLILTISPNNQPRHFVFTALCIWFLAAYGLAQVLVMSVKAGHSRPAQAVSLIAAFLFLGVSVCQRAKELQPMLSYAFEDRQSETVVAMQSYILHNLDLDSRILILGLFDQFNEGAIRWQLAISAGRAPSEISMDAWPQFDIGNSRTPLDITDKYADEALVLRAAAAECYYSQIVVINGKNSTNPYVVAAPSALLEFRSTSKLFDDYRVDIFDCGNRS